MLSSTRDKPSNHNPRNSKPLDGDYAPPGGHRFLRAFHLGGGSRASQPCGCDLRLALFSEVALQRFIAIAGEIRVPSNLARFLSFHTVNAVSLTIVATGLASFTEPTGPTQPPSELDTPLSVA